MYRNISQYSEKYRNTYFLYHDTPNINRDFNSQSLIRTLSLIVYIDIERWI